MRSHFGHFSTRLVICNLFNFQACFFVVVGGKNNNRPITCFCLKCSRLPLWCLYLISKITVIICYRPSYTRSFIFHLLKLGPPSSSLPFPHLSEIWSTIFLPLPLFPPPEFLTVWFSIFQFSIFLSSIFSAPNQARRTSCSSLKDSPLETFSNLE